MAHPWKIASPQSIATENGPSKLLYTPLPPNIFSHPAKMQPPPGLICS